MSPNLRRAAHQALDLILDALAEESAPVKTKKTRARATPPALPPDVTPEELARIGAHLARAGYQKAG